MTPTLYQQAKIIAAQGDYNVPTFDKLSEIQREHLAAASMRSLGGCAYEPVINAGNLPEITCAVISALEETDVRDRAALERLIGRMVLEGVIEQCRKPIDDALEEASTNLLAARHLDDDYEYRHACDPMEGAIYNSPNL